MMKNKIDYIFLEIDHKATKLMVKRFRELWHEVLDE